MIENKRGANTVNSTNTCAKSPPDCYTLCVITSSFSLNPHLYKQLSFDSEHDDPVFVSIGNPGILNMLETEKVKALLVPGSKRSPTLPNVPSFEEAGLPKFTSIFFSPLIFSHSGFGSVTARCDQFHFSPGA